MINQEQIKKSEEDCGNGGAKIGSLKEVRAAHVLELLQCKYLIYHSLILFCRN